MLLRKLLLLIFVLLQGLSPLLHAHAGGAAHGGIHMHQGDTPWTSDGPSLQVHPQAEPVAFTVETSLEARERLPLAANFNVVFRLPEQSMLGTPRWIPIPASPPAAPLACHLIPHPCAPPGA